VALVEAMAPWCAGQDERDRLARRVAHESGGNAFLAVTLLRDLAEATPSQRVPFAWPYPGATYDSTLPVNISAVVRNAIVARAAKLDEDTIAVLRAASVGGDVLDPALITEVLGLAGARVEAALDRLERERFVTFDEGRYIFTSRLLPAVVESECIQPGGRRRVRERFIAALAAREDIDSQLLRVRLLVAERHPDAFDAARRLAERALALGAGRTASVALRIAERTAGADPQRLALLEPARQGVGDSQRAQQRAVPQ
jgi:hypothetical protein